MTAVDAPRARAPGVLGLLARASVATAAARAAQFAAAALLARELGVAGYGLFTFALGAALVGSRLAAMGWPVMMQRFVPEYLTARDPRRLRRLLVAGGAVTMGGGAVLAAALMILAAWLGEAHALAPGLQLTALYLPVLAGLHLLRNVLAAAGRPGAAVAASELVPPLALLAALLGAAALPSAGMTATAALAAMALGGAAACLAGAAWLSRTLPAASGPEHPGLGFWGWMAAALPMLAGQSAQLLIQRADVLMLAPMAGVAEVGQYGAAMRLTYLQSTPVGLLVTVLTPRIAAALAEGNRHTARTLARRTLAAAGLSAGAIGAGLALAPAAVLTAVFGEAFAPAAPILAVLALGQVAAALAMVTGGVLVVSGGHRGFGVVTVAALALNVALNLWLIPAHGALGAAIASAAVALALLAAQGWLCRRLLWGAD